jgi:hypothetical protein
VQLLEVGAFGAFSVKPFVCWGILWSLCISFSNQTFLAILVCFTVQLQRFARTIFVRLFASMNVVVFSGGASPNLLACAFHKPIQICVAG